MSNAALQIVPTSNLVGEGVGYDNAVEFLGHVTAIGNAWQAEVGGDGGLHVTGKGARYYARWGNGNDKVGVGLNAADACLSLVAKLATDLKTWAAEVDEDGNSADLSAALLASIHLLNLEEFEVVR